MRPHLFELSLPGGAQFVLPAYGTFLVLGMLAAVWASRRDAANLGLSTRQVFDLGLMLVAAGVVGAHLLDALIHPSLYFGEGWRRGLVKLVSVWQGGLVYYGGLAAGIALLVIYARARRISVRDLLDFVAPLGALGLAVTRIGCFLNGCCYGKPTDLPWAIVYPQGSPAQMKQLSLGMVAGDGSALAVHPVQLYELLAALGMFWVLRQRFPRRRFAGENVAAFGVLYGSWRFVAEFLRADSVSWTRGAADPITVYQWMSLGLVALSLAGWLAGRRRSRRIEAASPVPRGTRD